ncbi:XRE family transcriptional regulator, partial [Corynebacterium diphtheriae]
MGEFIRLHREQTKPQDVGLRADGRRRTPGL